MTVGVAVLPDAAAAASADSGLTPPRLAAARRGRRRRPAPVRRPRAQVRRQERPAFDYNRQISASFTAGPYVVMYAAGYSDGRPRVPVSQDKYSEAEMTSMAAGVAH